MSILFKFNQTYFKNNLIFCFILRNQLKNKLFLIQMNTKTKN